MSMTTRPDRRTFLKGVAIGSTSAVGIASTAWSNPESAPSDRPEAESLSDAARSAAMEVYNACADRVPVVMLAGNVGNRVWRGITPIVLCWPEHVTTAASARSCHGEERAAADRKKPGPSSGDDLIAGKELHNLFRRCVGRIRPMY